MLQAFAAEVATPRARAGDVDELRRRNAALLEAIQKLDGAGARAADRAFHRVFQRLAGNRYLTSAIEPLEMHVHRLETAYFTHEQPGRESYVEHEAIIEAVAAGDAMRARDLVRANYQRFLDPATAGASASP
jgi:DNA-binding GntR family transcriptional regulator